MTGVTKTCKHCGKTKSTAEFSKLSGKKSTTYRGTCKACFAYKAKEKRAGVTEVLQGGVEAQNSKNETDPAFFKNDVEAQMPSDGDMLFWSTPYFDELIEGRKTPVNRMPKDNE